MCVQKKWIKNAYGRWIFVNCGHCSACKQSKAVQRSNRIRYNSYYDGSHINLFVTLTYRNECIPYFRLSDLREIRDSDRTAQVIQVPVYRDCYSKLVRSDASYSYSFKAFKRRKLLGYYFFDVTQKSLTRFKLLKGQLEDKVGVIYYRDLQNFWKKIRRKFEYYGFKIDFKYFSCAEYGPNTCRPHFHFIVTIPTGSYSLWKSTIASCWSYDDYNRTGDYVEVARNASAYVSSYVNSDASIPAILAQSPDSRPRHSYSQGYGMVLKSFSLAQVAQAIENRDLRFNVSRVRDGATIIDNILLPKYVIGRYFPKFKGFSRLSSYDIECICSRPSYYLQRHAYFLNYTKEDYYKTLVMIRNKLKKAASYGYSPSDYARLWSRVWTIRASQVLEESYKDIVSPVDCWQAYDNIKDFLEGVVQSPNLMAITRSLPLNPETDGNKFKLNLLKHQRLVDAYNSYSKDRKVRNLVMADLGHNV